MKLKPKQVWIYALLAVMAVAAFLITIPPNRVASQNLSMVQMFQPDEAAPLPYVLRMIAPSGTLNEALHHFIFYEYYYYGFPYFALSALVILPFQWLKALNDLPSIMLALRLVVSVLPMLAGLLILVYLQDGFRTYRSPVLFLFLLLTPAVLQNNLWWHPDGLTFFLVVMVIFFLYRDRLRFGRDFLLAAVFCGLATATKLVGAYFFLAVAATIVLGFLRKTVPVKRLAGMSIAFLGVMSLAFVAGNPFLLSHWARTAYINIFHKQTDLLSSGYGIVYAKGIAAAWPLMRDSYGGWLFLMAALASAVWGAWRSPKNLLQLLILSWFMPLTVMVLWGSHFKFQYWLPVALPLFSSLIVWLPEKISRWKLGRPLMGQVQVKTLLSVVILLVAAVQSILFISKDIPTYTADLQRAENNDRIEFYSQAVGALQPLSGQALHVYYDYRLYVPDTPGWSVETTYDLLQYSIIQQGNFDVLLLLEQRIRDYLSPDVSGIDPAVFALNQQFYRDAEGGTIQGYHLVYRNTIGLVFVRDELYSRYFAGQP